MTGKYLSSEIKWADIKIFDARPSRKMIVWAMDGIMKMLAVHGNLNRVYYIVKNEPENAEQYFNKIISLEDYNYEWVMMILDQYI